VEATARSAYDYGYNVVLVVDAMTDLDAAAHHHSLAKIFPRLGETDTTDNVLRLLKEARFRKTCSNVYQDLSPKRGSLLLECRS